nr:O-antigen ligase family protein [Lachnospiraceae bacterium]
TAEDDTSYYYYSGGEVMFKLVPHKETVPFLGTHYHFANMRGFIWARTIPLLKKYFFFGSGPDTFIIAFPNDDIVGLNNSGHINEIITKPHNMYLQIGTQTGVISLIALLVLYIWYIIDSLLIYWRNKYDNYMSIIGVGLMTAVIGYLISAITNDSCVAIAPIFYCVLGMGIGVNCYIKRNLPDSIIRKPKKVKATAENPSDTTDTTEDKLPETSSEGESTKDKTQETASEEKSAEENK